MQEPYDIEIGDKLQRKIEKLENKDNQYYNSVINKIIHISETPNWASRFEEF